jgi:hypothetical protein
VKEGISNPSRNDVMARTLTVLLRRDRSKDKVGGKIAFEGYQVFWPDGQAVVTGLDAFCKHGQRLLGLGRHLAGSQERLVELTCYPLSSRDDDLTRIPGHRIRRFYLERTGKVGRIHFLDGTPTTMLFEIGRDERTVLEWIGLLGLRDGGRQWFDLGACPVPDPRQAVREQPLPRLGRPTAEAGKR